MPLGSGSIGAAVYWSPDFAGTDEPATYAEINAGYTFANRASLTGAIGRQWVDDSVYPTDGYTTWNIGVTYPITEHLSIDARYVDVDDDAELFTFGLPQDQRFVATLKATF